jgi:hypothetical protein
MADGSGIVDVVTSNGITGFINVIVPILFGLFGWVLKALWMAVKDLQADDKQLSEKVNSIEVMVAGDYVRRDELASMFDRLMERLDKIDDKLDGKADKH